ncbi:hypothetical protein BDR04DRAFT_898109 [Suillus decipiens]|nr:hypothetical protein BDR04DRAFT_898109 [Suillus decipiens]
MQKSRERFNSEHAGIVAAAVEKAKSEITAGGASVNTEELSKKHTQELEALRAQLTAQHEAALKAAVDAATKAAKTETVTSSDEAMQAAIAAAIAAHDAELQIRHSAELDAAVERGRLESQAKSKIKDGQLVRSQARLKELEAQVLEWRKAGLVPDTPPPQTPTASTSKVPPPATVIASTSQPVTASVQAATAPNATAVKPATTPAGQPAAVSAEKPPTSGAVSLGVPRGRGRGAPPGAARGISIRGRGVASGRGGAPPPVVTSLGTTGMNIMGAASKRSREEDLAPDDSLAKRIKPAAETVKPAETTASKPPVTLRRPPPS